MSDLETYKTAAATLVNEGKLQEAYDYILDNAYDVDVDTSIMSSSLQYAVKKNNPKVFTDFLATLN